MSPQEDSVYLTGFTPSMSHLLLREFYGYHPHHNGGLHLDKVFAYDAVWKLHCRQLAAQFSSWYSTPQGEVWRSFLVIMAAELRGVLGRILNYERPLLCSHIILTKTLGVRQAREIESQISMRMDLWKMGVHAGLVVCVEAEGAIREGRDSREEEVDDGKSRAYHSIVLLGKLRKAVHQKTNRERGGEGYLPK